MRTYYVAYTRGIPSGPCCNGFKDTTLLVEAASDLDCLSADVWLYHGPRVTTKAQLRAKAPTILAHANTLRPAEWPAFTRVVVI